MNSTRTLLFFLLSFAVLATALPDCRGSQISQECELSSFVWNDSYQLETNQCCNVSIWFPNGTAGISNAWMTNNSDAWHNYSYTPVIDGFHSVQAACNCSGDYALSDFSFNIVNATTVSLNESITNINTTLVNLSINISSLNISLAAFDMYATIESSNEYTHGQECVVITKLEDEDGEPITGGTGTVTVSWPNNSIFVKEAALTELDSDDLSGTYYYNVSCPSVVGAYSAFINMTDGTYYDSDSQVAWHINDPTTPLAVTITFIVIICLFGYLAWRAEYPWSVVFTSFGGLTLLTLAMITLSFTGPTTFVGSILEVGINLAVTLAPFILGAVVLKMFWDFISQTWLFKKRKY